MPKRKEPPEPIRWGECGFTYMPSYYYGMRGLPDEQRRKLQDAIIEFAFTGSLPKLPVELAGYFALIKPNIEASLRSYQNGSKGGRPPKAAATPDDDDLPY